MDANYSTTKDRKQNYMRRGLATLLVASMPFVMGQGDCETTHASRARDSRGAATWTGIGAMYSDNSQAARGFATMSAIFAQDAADEENKQREVEYANVMRAIEEQKERENRREIQNNQQQENRRAEEYNRRVIDSNQQQENRRVLQNIQSDSFFTYRSFESLYKEDVPDVGNQGIKEVLQGDSIRFGAKVYYHRGSTLINKLYKNGEFVSQTKTFIEGDGVFVRTPLNPNAEPGEYVMEWYLENNLDQSIGESRVRVKKSINTRTDSNGRRANIGIDSQSVNRNLENRIIIKEVEFLKKNPNGGFIMRYKNGEGYNKIMNIPESKELLNGINSFERKVGTLEIYQNREKGLYIIDKGKKF